jgi:hypothetical protein
MVAIWSKPDIAGMGANLVEIDPTRTSITEFWVDWTKLPTISTLDDICRIWSKRASSTNVVASFYYLAVIHLYLIQQLDGNVACLAIVSCVLECCHGGLTRLDATHRSAPMAVLSSPLS